MKDDYKYKYFNRPMPIFKRDAVSGNSRFRDLQLSNLQQTDRYTFCKDLPNIHNKHLN